MTKQNSQQQASECGRPVQYVSLRVVVSSGLEYLPYICPYTTPPTTSIAVYPVVCVRVMSTEYEFYVRDVKVKGYYTRLYYTKLDCVYVHPRGLYWTRTGAVFVNLGAQEWCES